MKGYKNNNLNANMRINTVKNLFKKLIVTIVINIMLTGYIIPLNNVFAEGVVNYTTIECTNENMLKEFLEESNWDEFSKKNLNDNPENLGIVTMKDARYNLWQVKLPDTFIEELRKKGHNFNITNNINITKSSDFFKFSDVYGGNLNKIFFRYTKMDFSILENAYNNGAFDGVGELYMCDAKFSINDPSEIDNSIVWNSEKIAGKIYIIYNGIEYENGEGLPRGNDDREENITEPNPKYNGDTYDLISDNKKMLERIRNIVHNEWVKENVPEDQQNDKQWSVDWLNYFYIEEQNASTDGKYKIYCLKIAASHFDNIDNKKFTIINFGGINLENMNILPDFRIFKNMEKLRFSYCNIGSLKVFADAYQKNYFTSLPHQSIDLDGNTVEKFYGKTDDTSIAIQDFVTSGLIGNYPSIKGEDSEKPDANNQDDTDNNEKQDDKSDTDGNNEDDKNNADENNEDDKNNTDGQDISSIKEILETLGCPQYCIDDIKNGRFDRFNKWFETLSSDDIKKITRQQGQTLVDELGKLSNWQYSYTLSGRFKDDPEEIVYYNDEPAGWYNLTYPTELEYKNHKFYLSGKIEEYDGYDNKIGEISPYIYYYDPKGNCMSAGWGSAEIPVLYNGHYIVFIGLYGGGLWHRYDYDVTDIDNEKPQIKNVQETVPSSDVIGTALKITLSDNQGLRRLVVKKVDSDKSWETKLNGEKEKIVEQVVPENGTYEITAEDTSGNIEKQLETVEVDKTKPEPVGKPEVTIIQGENNGTYKGMPIVKEGDIVKVSIKANKVIKSIGYPNETTRNIGAIVLESTEDNYVFKKEMQNVNSNIIDIEIPITKELIEGLDVKDKSSNVKIQLNYVRDIYNNEGNDAVNEYTTLFKFDNIFYIDDSLVTLKKAEILADEGKGRSYIDKSGNKYMLIEKDAKYVINLIFNEELAQNPKLKIGNSESIIEAKYQNTKNETNNSGEYVYKAIIDCNELIDEGKLELNSDVQVVISNIIDKTSTKIDNVIIDSKNKFDKDYILHFGSIETNGLYIASKSNGEKNEKGDINNDGLINDYDYLLILRYASGLNDGLTEKQKENADVNNDGKITSEDALLVKKIVLKTVNYIYPGVEKTFNVFDLNNNKVTGTNLKWKVTNKEYENGEYKVKELVTDENNEIKIETNETNGELQVKVPKKIHYPITIEAYIGEDEEKTVGRITLYDGSNNRVIESAEDLGIGIGVKNTRAQYEQIGDINGDGYITTYDAMLVLRYSIGLVSLTNDQMKVADINGDGNITAADALLIQRLIYGFDTNGVDSSKLNTIKKGSTLTFEMIGSKEIPSGMQYSWDMITNNPEAFDFVQNNDGTVTLTVKNTNEVLPGMMVVIKGSLIENNEEKAVTSISLKIAEPDIEVDKEKVQIVLPENVDKIENEVKLNLNSTIDNVKLNVKNRGTENAIEFAKDENGNILMDKFGNIKFTAKETGETIIVVDSDDADMEKEIEIEVVKEIESITTNVSELSVKQGTEGTVEVTINPQDATEDLKCESNNKIVATVRKESGNTYKVYGNTEGKANIYFYSANNPEIIAQVNVNVEKQEMPSVTSVTVENGESGKVFTAGEEMIIRVNFSDAVKGTEPELSLKFGDHCSVNKAEFINKVENDKVLRYKYIVANGDNGELTIEKILGGGLTDYTGKVKADTTQDNTQYNLNNGDTDKEREYVNDGIYKQVYGGEADTKSSDIRIVADVDKDCNWLKNGDEIKVKIVSEEELKEKPTITFNGIKATVEGEGSIYTAKMQVNEELKDGYVEIKVDNIIDIAGNKKAAVVAKESNIDEPIIIDNSAPIIKNVNIRKEKGKELKEGESFDIIVNFTDEAGVTKEYITAQATPKLKLKFGGKAAKGTLTSEYKPGKYVQSIKYTYTVSAEDKGEVTLEGMSGTVTDVAGNSRDLKTIKLGSIINNNSVTNNLPIDKKDTTNTKKSPKTGDNILIITSIVVITIASICIAEILYRKNKKDKKNM